MNKRDVFLLQFLVLIFTGFRSFAQFDIDAQLRSRFELRNGYQKLIHCDLSPAAHISQRTRINLNYSTDNLKIRFSPQDARVWGDEQYSSLSSVSGDNASLDMFEGFAEIRLWDNNWISAGRQIVTYDNQWLLSKGDWSQNGASYDAVIFKFEKNDYEIHVGSMWNTLKENLYNNYYPTDRYKTVNYLWTHHEFDENFKFSLLHIASGQTKSDTSNTIYFRQTTGLYCIMQKPSTLLNTNIYYQYGTNQSGKKVSAYLIHFDLSQRIIFSNIGVGGSVLSGNKVVDSTQLKDNLFDPIYTSRHTYFGNMDFFRKFDSDTKRGGLIDVFAYVSVKPITGLLLKNCIHLFSLAQINSITPDSKHLGLENDFVTSYKFAKWGSVEFGFLSLFPTKSLKELQGINDSKQATFTYLQLVLTPLFFKQKSVEEINQ